MLATTLLPYLERIQAAGGPVQRFGRTWKVLWIVRGQTIIRREFEVRPGEHLGPELASDIGLALRAYALAEGRLFRMPDGANARAYCERWLELFEPTQAERQAKQEA